MLGVWGRGNFLIRRITQGFAVTKQVSVKEFKLRHRMTKDEYNEYFKDKLGGFDEESGQIILQIGKKYPDLNKLHNKFELYLRDYARSSNRNINAILSLLAAINLSGIESLSKYKSELLQQTNRVPLQANIQALSLNYFILNESDYRKSAHQKMKINRLLFNIMLAIQNNFEKVHPQMYFHIIEILVLEDRYQSNFIKIAHLMQKSLSHIMEKHIQNEKVEQTRLISDKFVCLLSEVYKIYGTDSPETMQIFFEYIRKIFFQRKYKAHDSRLAIVNTLFRNFNYYLKNADGIYYKQILLDIIISKFLNTKKEVESYAIATHGPYLCSSIITYKFYQYSQNFQYAQAGSFLYLSKQAIAVRPQLPSIFWQIYKVNPQGINSTSYVECMIKDVYADRYIPSKGKSNATIQPELQTEMKMRVEQALISLKINYKSQQLISGRYIDFVIQDDIILQIDGIQHFCINSLEMTDRSQARNVHLLLKGYRMIIVNIYEYNIMREMEEIRDLIQCKLQVLKAKNAILLL